MLAPVPRRSPASLPLGRWSAVVVLSGHLAGCYLHGTTGFTSPPSGDTALRGGVLRAHAGLNLGKVSLFSSEANRLKEGFTPALGAHVTSRVTKANQQGGVGLEGMGRWAFHRYGSSTGGGLTLMQLYGRGGLSLVQVGRQDSRAAVSIFSPSFELGTVWMLGNEDVPFWTLSVFAEHDLRVTQQINQSFVGVLLGAGFLK